ncbi:putative selenoprotein [Variovorax paradoxus]|uniref:Putative selenoprotein n=1 Tax=Variovorax paradoxus TaxID=34073 RepID=A0A5Q0MCA3_VARPD|nr:YbdD/YjiX family protein [Variovorax paradoxus]QFZ87149.1 putative selenoprotein [Variovorax paradoxus]
MGLALSEAGRYIARSIKQSLRLMVGLPDYDVYLTHMMATHPDRAPMSYEDFFRERLEARYGGGKGRCC